MSQPTLHWSCRDLSDGWVMLGVDADLTHSDQPEAMLGYRRAVHPFLFDDSPALFWEIIQEMGDVVGRVVGAPASSVSRARAFEG